MHPITRIFTALARRDLPGAHTTLRLATRWGRKRPPAQRMRASDRMTRREVLRLLITGGSLTLGAGAGGIGLFGIVRKLVNNAAPAATPSTGVIGSTGQAVNTAKDFVNPHSGHPSLLVRLPDGTFAAYEKACTHRGVFVNYDPGTRQLVCPAHAAIFDPAHKGAVVQGPATQALPQVDLHIAPNGSITAS